MLKVFHGIMKLQQGNALLSRMSVKGRRVQNPSKKEHVVISQADRAKPREGDPYLQTMRRPHRERQKCSALRIEPRWNPQSAECFGCPLPTSENNK